MLMMKCSDFLSIKWTATFDSVSTNLQHVDLLYVAVNYILTL